MPEEILIASKVGPTYHGGLATYQKLLGKLLAKENQTARYVFAQDMVDGLVPNREELPLPSYKAPRAVIGKLSERIWPSLGCRPQAHGVLQTLLEHSWKWPLDAHPGVVHCVGRGWDYFGYSAHAFARRKGARFTIWPASHPGESGDDKIDLRLYNMADAVFCQSQFEADYLAGLGLAAGKARLCGLPPMCLDTGDGRVLREAMGLGERPIVFFLGRGTAEKGYTALKAAWPLVLRHVPEAVVVSAGPGTAGTSDLPADTIRDLGVIDETTKANAYAACDVFCLPSAHESFGIVYVEAWSYGKPVICGTAPASRELVQDGVTGLWSDQDPEVLAEKLIFLLANRQHAQRMGQNGLDLQSRRFTTGEMLSAHWQAWGHLL